MLFRAQSNRIETAQFPCFPGNTICALPLQKETLMSSIPPVSAPEIPVRKGFSFADVQALGLILLILMVISLPIYQSVLQGSGKQTPTLMTAAHSARIETASVTPVSTADFKPDVSSPTKPSAASNSRMAR